MQRFARYGSPDSDGRAAIEERQKQGDLFTLKVRVVCESCNNGWMSELEERARRYLVPMIQGEEDWFDPDAAQTVATWAAKTAVSISYTDLATRAIPGNCRTWIMDRGEPPPLTSVWLAQLEAPVSTEIWCRSIFLTSDPEEIYQPREEPGNTYMTGFAVGRLYLMILGTTLDAVGNMQPAGHVRKRFTRLWPDPLCWQWPPEEHLQEVDHRELWEGYMQAFSRNFSRPAQQPTPEQWPI